MVTRVARKKATLTLTPRTVVLPRRFPLEHRFRLAIYAHPVRPYYASNDDARTVLQLQATFPKPNVYVRLASETCSIPLPSSRFALCRQHHMAFPLISSARQHASWRLAFIQSSWQYCRETHPLTRESATSQFWRLFVHR
jgi:hypothetical protein